MNQPKPVLIVLLVFIFSCTFLTCAASSNGAGSSTGNTFQFLGQDTNTGLQEFCLRSNGLRILLCQKPTSPVVTVMVVYKVGSRNEAVGYTGSTHFLEHMMFKGTTRHDPTKNTGIDDILKSVGGLNNATTSYDRTNYFEVVPSKDLSICLELEADRMHHALLRKTDKDSEMSVVRNELERNENYAQTILTNGVFTTAYREHPYHHPTIGWRSDVEGVPIERLRQFYNDFYYPNNAVLVIIGDFQIDNALNLIAQYFKIVPKSPKPFPIVYTQEPPQEGERRFIVQKGEEQPKLMLGYHIPQAQARDTYPLEVLASLLGDQQRQSSRLYKHLVDPGLASQAYACNYSMHDPGLFTIYASATTGTKLNLLENVIKDELHKLANVPISFDELEKAKKAVWKKLKLEASDPIDMADQLAEAIAVADWHWWVGFEKNIKAVTQNDIQRVAAQYFNTTNLTVGYYLPKKLEGEDVESPEIVHLPTTLPDKSQASAEIIPSTGKLGQERLSQSETKYAPIKMKNKQASVAAQVKKRVLVNGLTVLVMPVPGSHVVSVAVKLKAGSYFHPQNKYLVPELLAEMLNKGSKNISKETLAESLEMLGTSFEPEVQNFYLDFQSSVVTEDLGQLLSLISQVLEDPLLAPEELIKIKKSKVAQIKDAMAETSEIALNKLMNHLYPSDCVYHQKTFAEMLEELKSISTQDLKQFHQTYFHPANMVMAIVGDIPPEEAFRAVEKNFLSWRPSSKATINIMSCACNNKNVGPKKIITAVADKSNVDIIFGKSADVYIKSTDFYPAQLANAIFGHDTVSSRLAVLREKYGLTYNIQSMFLENMESYGPWVVQVSTNPKNVEKVMTLIQSINKKFVDNGIADKELETEKHRLAGEYIIYRMRTPQQLADALTKYELFDLSAKFMDEYPKNLQKVTQQEANKAIAKYMNCKDMTLSLAGTLNKVPEKN